MTITSDAYANALDAIRKGDLEGLKKHIHDPVDRGNAQRLTWIFDLVDEAARRGQADMVNHLLPCVPLFRAASARALAWAQAMEYGHEAVAQQWLPASPAGGAIYYGEAVDCGAWRTVQRLLNEGFAPHPVVADQTLQRLAQDEHTPAEAQALLERLVPGANSGGCAAATVVALRLKHEGWLTACLDRSTKKELAPWSKLLIQLATASDRHDWMARVLKGLGRPFTAGEWVTQHLQAALRGERLDFVEGALEAHPQLWERLNTHPHERDALAILMPALLPEDMAAWTTKTRIERLFHVFCPADRVGALRPKLEAHALPMYKTPTHPTVNRWLNAIAWWADEPTRALWFAEEPETFAPVIALVRSQQALAGASPSSGSSPRRARSRT